MKKLILLASFLFIFNMGCTNHILKYIESRPNLAPEISAAMKNGDIINGMTHHEVKLVLGEPSFIEAKGEYGAGRWVYRSVSGIKEKDAYNPDSAFPQGIGYVIPLNYQSREIRIDFRDGKVSKVEKILSFQS